VNVDSRIPVIIITLSGVGFLCVDCMVSWYGDNNFGEPTGRYSDGRYSMASRFHI